MAQTEFVIEISLENKPAARDPVAETIKRDLLAKKGYDEVSKVRSGQYLRINILANSEEQAKEIVKKMCNDLRIFNPVTQNLNILNVNKL
ncbi:MAG: phosphoribosylformylglycinamidine synthase subunit PurS [Candidatus Hermodarchaeota archaeon]